MIVCSESIIHIFETLATITRRIKEQFFYGKFD